MKIVARRIARAVVLSLPLAGPLAPLASAQQPAEPKPDVMQEAMKASARTDPDKGAYDVGAGVASVFYVPGKVALCGMSGVFSAVLLAVTFGNAYKEAAGVAREGGGHGDPLGDAGHRVPGRRPPLEEAARAPGHQGGGDLAGPDDAAPAERGRQAGLEIRDPVALERAQAGRLAGRGEADELHRWCPPGRRVPTAHPPEFLVSERRLL